MAAGDSLPIIALFELIMIPESTRGILYMADYGPAIIMAPVPEGASRGPSSDHPGWPRHPGQYAQPSRGGCESTRPYEQSAIRRMRNAPANHYNGTWKTTDD